MRSDVRRRLPRQRLPRLEGLATRRSAAATGLASLRDAAPGPAGRGGALRGGSARGRGLCEEPGAAECEAGAIYGGGAVPAGALEQMLALAWLDESYRAVAAQRRATPQGRLRSGVRRGALRVAVPGRAARRRQQELEPRQAARFTSSAPTLDAVESLAKTLSASSGSPVPPRARISAGGLDLDGGRGDLCCRTLVSMTSKGLAGCSPGAGGGPGSSSWIGAAQVLPACLACTAVRSRLAARGWRMISSAVHVADEASCLGASS